MNRTTTNKFTFDSRMTILDERPDPDEMDDVPHEPMFFRADPAFAYDRGGPITRAFVSLLPRTLGTAIIDSRVHMLMPGFYPCIPGWHHDDVPRTRSDGQPNYDTETPSIQHIMMLVNAAVAPTEFIVGRVTLPDVPHGERIYQVWDDLLNRLPLPIHTIPDRTLVQFDDCAFHRGTPAVTRGWRFFIRASFNTLYMPVNEVRTQVQVYLPVVNQGW